MVPVVGPTAVDSIQLKKSESSYAWLMTGFVSHYWYDIDCLAYRLAAFEALEAAQQAKVLLLTPALVCRVADMWTEDATGFHRFFVIQQELLVDESVDTHVTRCGQQTPAISRVDLLTARMIHHSSALSPQHSHSAACSLEWETARVVVLVPSARSNLPCNLLQEDYIDYREPVPLGSP